MMPRGSRPIPEVPSSALKGFRFPPEIIVLALRWYLRYGLSSRDVEELLGERGIEVDHVTVYRWVQRFAALFADAARPCRHAVGDRWFVDETYVKVAGRWRYVYRAIDQRGQIIDVYVSPRRDTRVARQFFTTALCAHGEPTGVVTTGPRRYGPRSMRSCPGRFTPNQRGTPDHDCCRRRHHVRRAPSPIVHGSDEVRVAQRDRSPSRKAFSMLRSNETPTRKGT